MSESKFSPTDAALEGFRITRERPEAVALWALIFLVVGVVTAVVPILTGAAAIISRIEDAGSSLPPAELLADMAKTAPAMLILLPFNLVAEAMLAAAVYRIVLRPGEQEGFGYLRLGSDELRLMGLTVIYAFLTVGVVFGVGIVGGVANAVVTLALGKGAGAAAFGVIFLWAVAVLIQLAVRLSLSAPQTFAERKVNAFGSWAITRGNFWRLAGAYLLALILFVVVWILVFAIFGGVAAVATGGGLKGAGMALKPDTSSVRAYFTLATTLAVVFSAALQAMFHTLMLAPAAVAYRQLTSGALDSTKPWGKS